MSLTTIHEAGHMLVAAQVGWPVESVTIDDDRGQVVFGPAPQLSDDDVCRVYAGGAAAELCVYGEILSTVCDLAMDIMVNGGDWIEFHARAIIVSETLDAEAIVALAESL